MAISLASATPVAQGVQGRRRFKVWQVNGPASYATGGTAFTPSEVGMGRIDWCEVLTPFSNGTTFVNPSLDAVAADGSVTLRFGWTSTAVNTANVQVANATNLSGYTGQLKFYGS